ncbi:uncharacterized protein SPPG_06668 [Spizellomyces punctatus DAOM BR117]|uniref:3-oxoacyl-[acyl-carrier-protein] reductase n=1 Tax=Spizellomyces punctatus (strain DAOM BR117) TaxID=645134 RepID=A0A0L0H9N7_SPIPD|nr:uncharacterized protein SPPG_06668 [Spizellomyces punctatus DAOM BR117]KNC98270.1 hypothetical protein SPPG_06668 [Spizellomyces punctatus DAOM BR117]|eukprot:XP_016606310.1 hypothetical protein SPPG_06668 [Spizellomyces punctatus DAOM BR117]
MPTTDSTLRNLSALVTGSSRGIGRSIALALAGEGCRLGLIARDKHKLDEVREECLKAGSPEAIVLACDVTKDEETAATIEKAKQKFGSINILVNNAGVGGAGPFHSAEWEKIRHVIDMNLMSYMRLTRLALPLIKDTGRGYIINIASVAGKRTMKGNADYSTSKAGVIAFSNGLFEDVRDDNIKVCAISPGYVETDMTANVQKDHAKFIRPEDIARTVLFVCKYPENSCPTEIVVMPQKTV